MTSNDVKALRKILNLSQSELTDEINKQFSLQYKRENIEDWEHGNFEIRKDIGNFIASLYHQRMLGVRCTSAQGLIPGDSLHVHNKEATSIHDQYFHYKVHEFKHSDNPTAMSCDLCDHYNLCDPTDRPCDSQSFNFYLKFVDLTFKSYEGLTLLNGRFVNKSGWNFSEYIELTNFEDIDLRPLRDLWKSDVHPDDVIKNRGSK